MPRCNRRDGEACPPLLSSQVGDICTKELMGFWDSLSVQQRKELLSVDKRELFQTIRSKYCSRCFGLFHLRWDELKSAPSDNPCPACSEYFCSLQVQPDGHTLTLEDSIVQRQPFTTFAEAKRRERERLLQYAGTGVLICGNEWTRSPGNSMCNLHTSNVPVEALIEYWTNLPEEHRTALFQLRDEDFAAELDAHLKYQLRICKDCRGNVTRAFRELRAKAGAPGEEMEVCEGHNLSIAEGVVTLLGEGDPSFFERAEEVEEFKGGDGDVDDGYSEGVRHAETPELAREALADCAILIFKGQVEVAFREQTAGHNALLLFVHLALTMMEGRLDNAFKDLTAKKAEAELMEMVAKDEAKEPKKAKKKAKKKAGKADGREDVALCGCGAVCDQCERCSRRSKSPVRGAPSLPVQAPKMPQASPGRSDTEEEDSQQKQQRQHRETVSPMRSPSRSTLGADLVSTPRQSPAAQALGLSAVSPGGTWETIPTGGKGRRSSTGGARKPATEQSTVVVVPRAVAAEPGPKRTGAQHAQQAARASPVAALQPHKATAQPQHQDSPPPSHQPRPYVRAVPVSSAPPGHTRAGSHGLSPASSLSLSEAQSPSAGSPASSHLQHTAHRHAPARAASHLGRPVENGTSQSVSRQDPQVAWKGGNPWHSRPAVDAQATCSTGSGKLFEQPVHAVHAFTVAWPPPPPPRQVPSSQGFHDAFSLFYHSPLARQSGAAESEASSAPGANQPPSYNLWGPSTPAQQAHMPLLHVVR